jgi:regulator of nucleoside diphosphate kinase
MTAQTLTPNKQIVVTAADFDRLQGLLDSPRFRATHAAFLVVLREGLQRSQVVAADQIPAGVVTMNAQVRVRDLRGRVSDTYTLVYPDDADIDEGKLSVLAPMGMALLGATEGQTIDVDAPAGVRNLKIERVLYQPEAAGDFHL